MAARLAMEGVTPDLARVNAEALLWLNEVANARVHGTTGERPRDRLALDQAAMAPFARAPAPVGQEPAEWPRYPLQRSPREYDVLLQGAGA